MNASTPTLTTIGPADTPTSSPSAAPTTADRKDRIFSGLETDLDCGGPVCSACRAGAILIDYTIRLWRPPCAMRVEQVLLLDCTINRLWRPSCAMRAKQVCY